MEGQPKIKFIKYTNSPSKVGKLLVGMIAGFPVSGDFISDPPHLDEAYNFIRSVLQEKEADPDFKKSNRFEIRRTNGSVALWSVSSSKDVADKMLCGFIEIESETNAMPQRQSFFLMEYRGYQLHKRHHGSNNKPLLFIDLINPPNSVVGTVKIESDQDGAIDVAIQKSKDFIDKLLTKNQPFPSLNKSHIMTLQVIPIHKIYPSKDNYRSEFDDISIKELSDSIATHGIIQPILVRPNGKAGNYEIVCGERRYRAARLVSLTEIPANIKELTDDQAFEMRITENLQRKDVHPMDEALAYKTYMDRNEIGIEELSAKFAKSKEYIVQRLSFNNLIPEMQKDFYSGKMLIGHAVQFARLITEDQKQAFKECKISWGSDKGEYQSIEDVKEWILDEVMHNLSQAAFSKKDTDLVPKAGPCTTCPKRSGGNLLFAYLKEDDRCFDGKCYAAKKLAHTINQVHKLVLTEPAMPAVRSWRNEEMAPEVTKLLKDNEVKILEKYDDFEEAGKKDKSSTMALVVAGSDAGRIIGIKFKSSLKAKSAKAASSDGDKDALTADMIDAQIAGIKERTSRSAELEKDKIHHKITAVLKDLKPFVEVSDLPLITAEYNALIYLAYENSGFNAKEKIQKLLKIKQSSNMSYRDEEMKIAESLAAASPDIKNFVVRCFIQNSFISPSILPSNKSPKAWHVRQVADGYTGVPVTEIEAEHAVILEKRAASAKKRIADLLAKKKELSNNKKSNSKTSKRKTNRD